MGLFRYTTKTFARELALIVAALIFAVPVYLLVTLSLKTTSDIFTKPLSFPTNPTLSNFSSAWSGAGTVTIGHSLVNSAIITAGSVAGLIAIGSVTSYAIARRPTKMGTATYIAFLFGIIVPFQLGVVPIFVGMHHLHLIPSYYGMILLNVGLLMPLTVFLYTGFVRSLPTEYEEAARVDGATMLRTFVRVVFPLLRPITGTVAVLTGVITWNEFFLSLVFLGGSHYQPLPVSVYQFVGEFISQWNHIFAAVVIAVVPILAFYLFAQKQLIRGFASGIRG